ncbi:MAG: transporter substrate-binding domain-containing protein [Desulfovibrionaceae bacterium]|nr:transporter substrate-binding domain-containing protein [Desulfovibrionaceae bacterium]
MFAVRKSLLTLLAVALALFALSGAEARAGNRVRLVCDIWPPYQFRTGTGVGGMSVEIVKAVYGRLGYTEFDIQAFPWKRAMDAIRFGEADALFSANLTTARAVYLCYPDEPLFESSWVVWTRAGSCILTLDDLRGKRLGVVLGYSYTDEFREFIQANCLVEEAHNDRINFKKLSLGRLDALVAESGNGAYLTRALNDESIIPIPRIEIKKDGLYVVFNRKQCREDFVKRFSEELKAFKQTEEHRLIRAKYLGVED